MRNSFCVVTPNYNMGDFLVDTIESVLENLRDGDAYFVIDGGSTDNSVEIIRRYEDRLTGWVSEPDHGYADALAKGFERCNNDYQCWINSGDLLLRGALDAARAELSRSGADLIFGDDLYVDEAGKVIRATNGQVSNLRNFMLYGGWTPLQDACYWRSDLYRKTGGIDVGLRYAADYDFFLRASLVGKCKYVSTTFSAFRQHRGQTSIRGVNFYKQEREYTRRSQLRTHGQRGLAGRLMAAYYWLATRWRVRIQGAQRNAPALEGLSAREISSYSISK
jgi:glycosyltransferase involved in cell wall biosynthesis